jgi:hypothetical protein
MTGSKDGARCGAPRLIRTFDVLDTTKEETMHPLQLEEIARQHIEDLHRDADQRRPARGLRRPKSERRRWLATRLQRAPAH